MRPSPAVRFGLKYAAVVSAALWIGYAYGLPQATWPLVTVLMVAQPSSGAAVQKGLLRIVGTAAAGLVAIGIYGLFAQAPVPFLVSMIAVLTLSVYGMTGPRHPYAWNVFGFTTIIILGYGFRGSVPIETVAFERASLVALGVLIVMVADALFWPSRSSQELRVALAARSRQLAQDLDRALAALVSPAGTNESPSSPAGPPASPLAEQLALADQMRSEVGETEAHADALSRGALVLEAMASRIRLLASARAARTEPWASDAAAAWANFRMALASDLARSASRLERGESGMARDVQADAIDPASALERLPMTDAAAGILLPILRDLTAGAGAMRDVAGADERDGSPRERPGSASQAPSVVRWSIDPGRLQLGLRSGIAACAALVGMLLLGWPVNVISMIVAWMVASMPTRGGGTTTALLAGLVSLAALALADLAIVFVFPHIGRMPVALVWPALMAGGLATLGMKRPKLLAIVPLASVIAILSVYGGSRPPDNVAGAYNMAVYLLFGLAVGLVVQRVMWPASASRAFRLRAGDQLDLCRRALEQRDRSSDASGLVGTWARQIVLLGQLHGQAQLEPVEAALDGERRARLLALLQALFDASLKAGVDPPESVPPALEPLHGALEREREAALASLAATAAALRGEPVAPAHALAESHAAVESEVAALRGRPDLAQQLETTHLHGALDVLVASHLPAIRTLELEAWRDDWCQAAG